MRVFEKKLPVIYLVFGGLACVFFAIFIPPFRIPDEQRHYLAASALVEGHVFCNDGQHLISKNRLHLIEQMGLDKSMVVPPPGFDWTRVFSYQSLPDSSYQSVRTLVCGAPLYGHTAAAVGIFLAHFFSLSPIHELYFGRVFNSVFGLLLVAAAIRITPDFKRLFFALGLLPVVLLHFATISYDSLSTPGLFLLFAVFLRLIRFRSISKWWLMCCLPGIAAVILKPFYYPIFFVFSFLLFQKFFLLRKLLIGVNILVLGIIFYYLTSVFLFHPSVNNATRMDQYTFFQESNVHLLEGTDFRFDQLYQIKQIIFHPLIFIKASLYTSAMTIAFLPAEFFGYLGLDVRFYFGMGVVVLGLMSVLGLWMDGVVDKFSFYLVEKRLLVFGVVSSVILLYMYLFIANTAADVVWVNGVQGKYFVPLLLIAAAPFAAKSKITILASRMKIYYLILVLLFVLMYIFILQYLFLWYGYK